MFLLLLVRDEVGAFFKLFDARKARVGDGWPVALVTLDEGLRLLDALGGPGLRLRRRPAGGRRSPAAGPGALAFQGPQR